MHLVASGGLEVCDIRTGFPTISQDTAKMTNLSYDTGHTAGHL